MAKCTRCGKPAGLIYALCPECIALTDEQRRQPPQSPLDATSASAPDVAHERQDRAAGRSKAICESCGQPFEPRPKKDWLGFQKVKCPHCAHRGLYPLTDSYRTIYWVLLVLLLLGAIVNLSQGRIPVPGVLGLLAILALVKDARIRKEVAARAPTAQS